MIVINGGIPLKKTLQIMEPIIISFPRPAFFNSMILTHKYGLNWLISNYIQPFVIASSDSSSIQLQFVGENQNIKTCPLISYQCINKRLLAQSDIEIKKIVINALDNNTYIYTQVNHRFFRNSITYNRDFNHPLLIYGYDIEKNTLSIADNHFSKIQKFSFSTCSIDEFIEGYYNTNLNNSELPTISNIELFSLNEKAEFVIQREYIINMFKDYLNSKNSLITAGWMNTNQEFAFGVDIYFTLIRYISEAIRIDVRPFVRFLEHKKINNLRIRNLRNELNVSDFCLSSSQSIEDKATIILSLIIKYNIVKSYSVKKNIKKNIIDKLLEIRLEEINFIQDLISCS